MHKQHKDLLRALVRELRYKLVGSISPTDGKIERGDLDRELERLGIAPDGTIKPIDALTSIRPSERYAYRVAVEQLSALPQSQRPSVRSEIIERAAYTWINRLLALRAMEVRGLIDNTLRGDEAYGGVSEKLFLIRETQPERATGEDGGWWAVIEDTCNEQASSLPGLFLLNDPVAALRPSAGALVQCITLIAGNIAGLTFKDSANPDAAFADPDAIGWAYQFYQEENKALIYAKLGNGGKAASRSEIAAATQLFTEPYMVQWLLQNSLGRSYHEIYPHSTLPATWPYYIQPEKPDTSTHLALSSLTLLDPCVGSGHFLRAAFDMFVAMYREQFPSWSAQEIANQILVHHLHGIDLDPRAAQLTALTLYLRAWELVRDERQQRYLPGAGSYIPPTMNLATTPTNLDRGTLTRHLQRHPEAALFQPLIEEIFAGLEQAEILGSLLRPREYLANAITALQKQQATQLNLFDSDMDDMRVRIAQFAQNDPDELKKLAFQQVMDSFKAEAGNIDDVGAMLFGREAEQGVKLFQLLDKQYAIVVTNPPYMGSKNMSPPLKKYVETYYSSGRRDLYAAFILRCLELCQSKGRVAMVTMQSWMFLRSFAELRVQNNNKEKATITFNGLLKDTSIEGITHLGRYAFSEIVNAVVAPVLFITRQMRPSLHHQVWACRLTAPRPSEEQAALLLKATQMGKKCGFVFAFNQTNILNIPETPIVYWLRPNFFDLLRTSYRLQNVADVRQGLATGENERFLRCFWEIKEPGKVLDEKFVSGRWFWYAKGGGYCKWVGLEWLCIDWDYNGSRIKASPSSVIRSPEYYFKPGLTYTLMASGSLAMRLMDKSLFDMTGIGVFPSNEINSSAVAAMTSVRVSSYLMRVTTQDLKFSVGYLNNLPLGKINSRLSLLDTIGTFGIQTKNILVGQVPTERRFSNISLNNLKNLLIFIHTLEGLNEKISVEIYNLDAGDKEAILSETGTPAGWYPLIANYDTLPALPDNLELPPLPQELFDYLDKHERIVPDSKELARIKTNLRALYEAGPGAKNVEQKESHEATDESEGEDGIASGAHIPIPTETFLEELSVKMQIHPISVYRLLEELRKEGVRCKPEEQRLLEDRLSVLVLRLLGHRWPKQIEVGEVMPEWTEQHGIMPLVSGTGKTVLADRLRERLRAEDGAIEAQQVENLLEELTGLNLEEWLRRRFFPRHISQFKYRPVVWQLASTPGKSATRGKKSRGGNVQRRPAFECILYYHACTSHALARIRNDYVEPLIQSERSKIERNRVKRSGENNEGEEQVVANETAAAIASERIRELEEFVQKLHTIEERGFACDELQKLLAQEPLDRWCGDGYLAPHSQEELLRQEQAWHVDINDGVRVNIAPLQLAGVLANDVLKVADARKALADRARWRSDERRWVREGKLPRCGWLDERIPASQRWDELEPQREAEQLRLAQKRLLLEQGSLVLG